jgi:hypothetical protein
VSCRGTVLYGKHLLHPSERPAAASILFLQGFGDHCNSPYHAEQVMLHQWSSLHWQDQTRRVCSQSDSLAALLE